MAEVGTYITEVTFFSEAREDSFSQLKNTL